MIKSKHASPYAIPIKSDGTTIGYDIDFDMTSSTPPVLEAVDPYQGIPVEKKDKPKSIINKTKPTSKEFIKLAKGYRFNMLRISYDIATQKSCIACGENHDRILVKIIRNDGKKFDIGISCAEKLNFKIPPDIAKYLDSNHKQIKAIRLENDIDSINNTGFSITKQELSLLRKI